MAINVFAGARRLAVLAGVLTIAVGVFAAESPRPYLTRTDKSLSPYRGCFSPAQTLDQEIQTPNGHTVTLSVCYMVYSAFDDVVARERLRELADTVNRAALDQEANTQRWKHRQEAAQLTGVALATIIVMTLAAGWVARGFLGIPRGHDFHPAPSDAELQGNTRNAWDTDHPTV